MPDIDTEEYLFVYGSLQSKANHTAHNVLKQHAELVCEAEFEGHLFLVRDYPGVVTAPESPDRVKGELYRLTSPAEVFSKLDRYEGYDPNNPAESLYLREKREIHCQSGSLNTVLAWIYLFNRPTDKLHKIASGDYLSFIRQE